MKLNLPNKITITRIFLIPVILFLYLAPFVPYGKLIATVIFVIATTTDFIDGYIARSRNMVTTLCKFLDPMADKLLAISMLVVLTAEGVFNPLFMSIVTVIIVSRELVVSGLRQVAASKNVVIAADMWGKIKATFQDIAIPALMIVSQMYLLQTSAQVIEVFEIIAYSFTVIATLLTIFSGINYVVKNKHVFSA